MTVLRFVVVSSLLLLTGCNRTLREALERAEVAHGRGDHFGEAIALRDACAAAPDEPEICRPAKEAAQEVITRQLATVEGPCASDPVACLAGLEVLAPLAKADDPRLTGYYDRAGAMLAQRCEAIAIATVEDAVFHVRCFEAYRQRVPTPGYAARTGLARQRAAVFIDAEGARRANEPGVAWLYGSLASCLGGSQGYGARAQQYRKRFDDAHAIRFDVSGQGPLSGPQLCGGFGNDLSGLLRCEAGPGAVRVRLDAWTEAMTDSPLHERKSVEVLDHTERWDNPDYRHAQAEVRRARNREQDAAQLARLADGECDTARSVLSRAKSCYNCRERTQMDQVCNRKDAMSDIARRARSELSEAERFLSNTPAYLTRDVYRTVTYREVQHRFQVPWRVQVSLGEGAGTARRGVMQFDSVEREGVRGTNVAPLRYSEPSRSQLDEKLRAQSWEVAAELLTPELQRIATQRIAACPQGDWSDCQVEGWLLRRGDPVKAFVDAIGERVDARTPQPFPKAQCAQ